MSSSARPTTYVIGHRNPDADSICSAVAYAAFKEARGESGYVAARCGNSNARIDAILTRFQVPLPVLLNDVSPRVRDVMATEVDWLQDTATCAEALTLFDRQRHRLLPVLASSGKIVGTLTNVQLAHAFLPHINEPVRMRLVTASLEDIRRTLQAEALHIGAQAGQVEDYYIRIGAMELESFLRVSLADAVPLERSLIIVGDRRDVQEKSIELGVCALVISGGHQPHVDVQAAARARGVSLLISPYDTATTAWLIRTASRVAPLMELDYAVVSLDARLADVRRTHGTLTAPTFLVRGDDGGLAGVISKSDLLRPVPTRLVLVDHNELSQAVPGADEVTITEILDHHRLSPMVTPQPILFINEPVGSTCTIVADLYRRYGLRPSPDVAGLMMSGLISDTLLLQSPTTTPKDVEILGWLETQAGTKARPLADLIFSSGSVILASPPERVVRSDFKIYTEEGVRFSVSQVEELGFDNFQRHADALGSALASLRRDEGLVFAALLVTDINTQNSLLLVKGEADFIRRITYAQNDDEVFDLPGVVSRKKQLIPYLTSLLRGPNASVRPAVGRGTSAPFGGSR